MALQNKISVFGGFGFVLGEFIRQFPEQCIRVPKNDVFSPTPLILYGISTTDNYNVFDSPTLDIETNLLHLMDVLDTCHKTYGNKFEFIFISSWFVYGKQPETKLPLSEDIDCHPKGFYGITKYAAEQLLTSYCETFKIKYKILRLANILGYRDRKISVKRNALQFLINKLVHNEDIELYDGGEFYRDYIDVRDCVRAIKLAMGGEEIIYNISNGISYKFKDIINLAIEYSESKSRVLEKQSKPEFHSIVQSKNIFLSNEKIKKVGYVPEITIDQTIKSIINEYRVR